MSLKSLLSTTATLQTPTNTQVTGGYTVAYAETTFKCRVQPRDATEALEWGYERDDVVAVIYVETPNATAITNASRIVVGSTTYEVRGKKDTDLQNRLTAVSAVELRE